MKYFLAKTEPSSYSIDDLQREAETWWDGVHSYQAINVIKTWNIGDLVIIYHSVKKPSVVGLGKVISEPMKDEDDERGISWKAKVAFVRKFETEKIVSLKKIKDSGLFSDFYLIKQSRLSTMPCPDNFIDWLKSKGLDLNSD